MNTTTDLMSAPITLLVNRDSRRVAMGTVFLDTGNSAEEMMRQEYEYYTIQHKRSKSLIFQLSKGQRGNLDSLHTLDKVVIADAQDLNTTDFACAIHQDGFIQELKTIYDNSTNTLSLFNFKWQRSLKFS